MRVHARLNRAGRVHFWPSRRAFEAGEASAHHVDPRTDPWWAAAPPSPEAWAALQRGELVEFEDPGYFESEDA